MQGSWIECLGGTFGESTEFYHVINWSDLSEGLCLVFMRTYTCVYVHVHVCAGTHTRTVLFKD